MGILVGQKLIHFQGHVFAFTLYVYFDNIQLSIKGGDVNLVDIY